ncbi:hypothetical protein HSX11_02020 [Oxalobacteraceae bacterium]|nr:hypothetical protein [Oxalobacteraceae bacterium]
MVTRWETADSVWLEQANGQFELASSKDLGRIDWQDQARSRLPDVAQLLGAALPACGHGAIYPEGFAFCPACGQALTRNASAPPEPASTRQPAWWNASSRPSPIDEYPLPRQVPQGLAITALPLAAALETRPPEPHVGQAERKMPAPPNALCVFAAGYFGFAAARLLALAYTRNVLQYWDPLAARWHVMSPEAGTAAIGFSVSGYAWLPAAPGAPRGECGLIPSAAGLLRLFINPVSDTFRTETVLHAPLVGAPGALGRQIACLFQSPGGVRLWSALADGSDPEVFDCPGAELPAGGWQAPVCYDGKLFWLHEQGQLLWQAGSAPQWLPWPQGWQPRLQMGGPVTSRLGQLWQLGKDSASYSFLELGRANAQMERLDGARLGFGTLLFRRGHQVKDDPWELEDVEDPHQEHVLALPLLENVSSTRSQPTGLVLRIEQPPGVEAVIDGAVLGRTLIEWIGQRNVILDEAMRLSRPGDCVPFVYDDSLWLHHPSWNEIRGWRLKALP